MGIYIYVNAHRHDIHFVVPEYMGKTWVSKTTVTTYLWVYWEWGNPQSTIYIYIHKGLGIVSERLFIMVFHLVFNYQMWNIPWENMWGMPVIVISGWKYVHFFLVTSCSAACIP